jgi:two-component system sensor histidine kinase GlrK
MVRGDVALLRIVVDNVIDNALKFSKLGKVRVDVTEEPGEVHVTVRDEGPGVDPADADRLLLAFTRGTRPTETSVPGHGLGLSIVAHAVRLHGGDVRFVPCETGAEVRVTLPAWSAS